MYFDAADGRQWKHIMAQQPIDIIIMDVNLPAQSGLELAEFLREQDNIGLGLFSPAAIAMKIASSPSNSVPMTI